MRAEDQHANGPTDGRRFLLAADQDDAHARAASAYSEVARILTARLPSSVEIRHVGATAVPGCLTKGDLDVVVRVPPEAFAEADGVLASLFARNEGSDRTETFSAFTDEAAAPPLGVQLTVMGGPYDDFHAFVEALRASPSLLHAYNALKREQDGVDMDAYRLVKHEFVERVLSRR